jgi:hypothetical protein
MTAYRVHAELRAATREGNPQRGGLTSEWDVVFQNECSRGERWFWDNTHGQGLADRWVTTPGGHYEFPGLWVRLPEMVRASEMAALEVTVWNALLAEAPSMAERILHKNTAYVVLRYEEVLLPQVLPLFGGENAPWRVRLWLREDDAVLVAAEARRGGDGAIDEMRVTFHDGDGEPEIVAPPDAIDEAQPSNNTPRS